MSYEIERQIETQIQPLAGELIFSDYAAAVERLRILDPIHAVQLVLSAYLRGDSVITEAELLGLAEFLGVFGNE
jgi:hypothetical protein